MATQKQHRRTAEFGDFQTPKALARTVCRLLARQGLKPASIVEPTCGIGGFLSAALDEFADARQAIGVEINTEYARQATTCTNANGRANRVRILTQDFFQTDWRALLSELPEPILVIGNPPWVTNSELGAIGSSNLPLKRNFQNYNGLDAITGKSNFDISEWMLLHILKHLSGRSATVAMLCKTLVARKVLLHAWNGAYEIANSTIHLIDASEHFGASVDACLLTCHSSPAATHSCCPVYEGLDAEAIDRVVGFRDGQLIANVSLYDRWKHLQGSRGPKWRSGIKHDCTKVMELRRVGSQLLNGHGKPADIEDDCVYPLLKSSDLANGSTSAPRRWMLVTQRSVGDDTSYLEEQSPRTWQYLQQHASELDRRASVIYKKRPRFSIFGVGPYSFSPWKVAISGFYKKLAFRSVGDFQGKPIVLDDTSYFIPCRTEAEANYITTLLNSDVARAFFLAFVFWDAKRPITVELLNHLDLLALAHEFGSETEMTRYLSGVPEKQQSTLRQSSQLSEGLLFR
ncbi:SAM-dependent methyltransferase [bacterium]|nr:SAM-dependent methyltransferase [bacterium]